MSLNKGLSFKLLYVNPCTLDASMSISLSGFIYLWKVLLVIFLLKISMHPISIIYDHRQGQAQLSRYQELYISFGDSACS